VSFEQVRTFFLWCTVVNYGLLLLWAFLLMLPHAWMYWLWGKSCGLSAERFDEINFTGMVFFKMGVILFNLVPYVALRIVG
jgi:hypothetical protein